MKKLLLVFAAVVALATSASAKVLFHKDYKAAFAAGQSYNLWHGGDGTFALTEDGITVTNDKTDLPFYAVQYMTAGGLGIDKGTEYTIDFEIKGFEGRFTYGLGTWGNTAGGNVTVAAAEGFQKVSVKATAPADIADAFLIFQTGEFIGTYSIGSVTISGDVKGLALPEYYEVVDEYFTDKGKYFGGWGAGDRVIPFEEDGKKCIKFTNTKAVNPWESQLKIGGNFPAGQEYYVTFDVKGDLYAEGLNLAFQQSKDYQGRGDFKAFNVEPTWQTYVGKCTVSGSGEPADADGLLFSIGRYVGTMYIANVKIIKETEAPSQNGLGSKEDPYIIATAADLVAAHEKIVPGAMTYFLQVADIDMTGVTDYVALNGFDGKYTAAFTYDGGNHLITGFAPADKAAADGTNNYYCTSIFGVLSGKVCNLGVVDAKINTAQGAGILGAYMGHSAATAAPTSELENVFVTGNITGTSYTGGMIGTTGTAVSIKDCYAQVNVEGTYAGGIIGRLRNPLTIANTYAKATVKGSGAAALVAATDNKTIAVTATDVVAIGEGNAFHNTLTVSTPATVFATVTPEAINAIQAWAAFNEGYGFNGAPALNWQKGDRLNSGIDAIQQDNAPVEYFNLQGVRVDRPTRGLYIRRQGNTATKVIL